MKNQRQFAICLALASLTTHVLLLPVSQAGEATFRRKGKFETHIVWHTISGSTTGRESGYYGDWQELSNANVFGFGGAYNFNEHWNLTMNMLFGSQDMKYRRPYSWQGDVESVTQSTDLFLWDWLVSYNLLTGRVTPVVMAGFSIIQQESELAQEQSAYVNWGGWDNTFSVTWGAGGRWDVSDRWAVEVLYRSTEGKSPVDEFPIAGFSVRVIGKLGSAL